MTAAAPKNWWHYHHADCGTQYRGCHPTLCPKEQYEQTGEWHWPEEPETKGTAYPVRILHPWHPRSILNGIRWRNAKGWRWTRWSHRPPTWVRCEPDDPRWSGKTWEVGNFITWRVT